MVISENNALQNTNIIKVKQRIEVVATASTTKNYIVIRL